MQILYIVTIKCSQLKTIDYTWQRLNPHRPFWATVERNTICFTAAGEKWSQPNTSDASREKAAGSWCGGTTRALFVALEWLCHRWLLLLLTQPRLASVLPAATTLTILSCLCPFGLVVEWSKARGFFEPQRNPSSSDSRVSEFDGWTSSSLFVLFFVCLLFFKSLCIAASGLHEDCWVCMHFNK